MLLLALAGCLSLDDAAIFAALDYTIDRPRLLGMRVDPPLLSPGVEVTLDALFVAPRGQQASAAAWSTCGLGNKDPVTVQTLECFSDGDDVEVIYDGALPALYTPNPRPDADCAGDTGVDFRDCVHSLPLLVASDFAVDESEPTRGVSQVEFYLEEWDDSRSLPVSAGTLERALTLEGVAGAGAEVALRYSVPADLRNATFRWYVDGGTLLDTGETSVREWSPPEGPNEKGVSVTTNRWVLPEEAGEYRAFVLFEGQGWKESSVNATAPDFVWDSLVAVVRQ